MFVSTLVQRVLIIWTGGDKFKKGWRQERIIGTHLTLNFAQPSRHPSDATDGTSPNKLFPKQLLIVAPVTSHRLSREYKPTSNRGSA